MSPTERPGETAQRKLTEKTGVGAVYLEQLQTYAEPDRDPRGWIPTVAYLALIDAAVLRTDETGARWVPVDPLPALGFDHAQIVRDGVERLRGKLWWSNIAVGLLPERFTMPQARRVFEAISGIAYEPSNFRRELELSGLHASAKGARIRLSTSSSSGSPRGACAARGRPPPRDADPERPCHARRCDER